MGDILPAATTSRRKVTIVVAVLVALITALMPTLSEPALAADPSGVSFKLEGCRANADSRVSANVCQDGYYTTGNLDSPGQGPSWNELDLVPHRLTANAGHSAPDTQSYDIGIAVDSIEAGVTGYNKLSVPVLNTSLSSSSCAAPTTVTGGTNGTPMTPGIGGTDTSLARTLTISQPKNSTCVYDFWARLAIGASGYSGSSLHANLIGDGSKDVSIPVNKILPQSISKTMGATHNTDYIWSVTKGSDPLSLNFADTCSTATGALSRTVDVTVTWTKDAASTNGYTIVTHVYADNPASRVVTVSGHDVIKNGPSTTLETVDIGPIDVPAATTHFLILTHTLTGVSDATAGATPAFNDVATVSYTDKDTGEALTGTTTASASVAVADIDSNGTNGSATVTDSESITGSGLTFSVATPSVGSFTGGYVANTHTTGPVGWSAGTVTSSGSVTFHKTVYASAGTTTASGSLDDTASWTPSNGTLHTAAWSVAVTSSATVKVNISKTLTNALVNDITFTFRVKNGAGTQVGSTTILIPHGTVGPVNGSIGGLAQGTSYTLWEDAWGTHAASQIGSAFTITAPSCSTGFTVNNDDAPAHARVRKITDPTGSTSWTFTLTGPGGLSETKSATAGAGYVSFDADLDVDGGSYTITETGKLGWDNTGIVGDVASDATRVSTGTLSCSFTYHALTDDGHIFECTFTNTQRGTISIHKTVSGVAPSGTQAFTFELRKNASVSANGTILDTEVANSTNGGDLAFSVSGSTLLVPGTYQVCESIDVGWSSTIQTMTGAFVPGTGGDPTADNQYVCVPFRLDPGQTGSLTIDNSPPPGGMAKTIGYWKNHASCKTSNGNQNPVLDSWLGLGPITIGDLSVSTCPVAVDLLNKTKVADPAVVGDGKKAASDPAFNVAAQLLAYRLNIRAGADSTCTAANTAATAAQALLAVLDFDGDTHAVISKANATLLNGYNATLDGYNNNTLCT